MAESIKFAKPSNQPFYTRYMTFDEYKGYVTSGLTEADILNICEERKSSLQNIEYNDDRFSSLTEMEFEDLRRAQYTLQEITDKNKEKKRIQDNFISRNFNKYKKQINILIVGPDMEGKTSVMKLLAQPKTICERYGKFMFAENVDEYINNIYEISTKPFQTDSRIERYCKCLESMKENLQYPEIHTILLVVNCATHQSYPAPKQFVDKFLCSTSNEVMKHIIVVLTHAESGLGGTSVVDYIKRGTQRRPGAAELCSEMFPKVVAVEAVGNSPYAATKQKEELIRVIQNLMPLKPISAEILLPSWYRCYCRFM